jgi:hypothetical protein
MSEFVTFEISKKLKEKGFPQRKKNTLAMYNDDGEWFSLARYLAVDEYSFDDFDERDCVCPTIAQVLKWMRDVLEIDILSEVVISHIYDLYRIRSYSCKIYSPRLNKPIETDYFDSYEEAALAGIDYVLNNLI